MHQYGTAGLLSLSMDRGGRRKKIAFMEGKLLKRQRKRHSLKFMSLSPLNYFIRLHVQLLFPFTSCVHHHRSRTRTPMKLACSWRPPGGGRALVKAKRMMLLLYIHPLQRISMMWCTFLHCDGGTCPIQTHYESAPSG